MSKLPHLIKKHLAFPPKSRPLSLPLVDRSTSLLTGLWATVQTLSRPFSMVSSACLAQTERRTPAPLCPGASLTPVSLRGDVRLLAGYQGCSKPASPELHLWQLSFHSTFITRWDGAGTQCCDFVAESYFLFHPHFLNIQPSYHFFQAPFPASPSRGNALTCRVTSVF